MAIQGDQMASIRLRKILNSASEANNALRACGSLDVRQVLPSPRVVVVGNQSHGKSSVVSRLMNIQLPSAPGLCTRAPLRIATRISAAGEPNKAKLSIPADHGMARPSSGGWLHISGTEAMKGQFSKNLLEVDGVCMQWPPAPETLLRGINEATVMLAGDKNYITGKEMLLEWESPDVPNLDVLDLPGLTKVKDGDQDIETPKVIQKVVKDSIEDKSTIIVLVVSGMEDMSTSHGLEVVTEHDADLSRTIVVITKMDMFNNAQQIPKLQEHLNFLYKNKYKPLDVVLVKNGSPSEDLSMQRMAEQEFLRVFSSVQEEQAAIGRRLKLGISEMSVQLSTELEARYEAALPLLKSRLDKRIMLVKEELEKVPEIPAVENVLDITCSCLEELYSSFQLVEAARFSDLPATKGRMGVKETDMLYTRLMELQLRWFKETIAAPPYMDDQHTRMMAKYWELTNGKTLDDASTDAQRKMFQEVFVSELREKLHELLCVATSVVQETYDSIVDEVFHHYEELGKEVKRVLALDVVSKLKDELKVYLDHTFEAHRVGELMTLSPMYDAAMRFYDEYVKGQPQQTSRTAVGALGVESMLLGSRLLLPDETENLLTGMLERHRITMMEPGVARGTKTMLGQQWQLLVYNVIVHNSLMDLLPRVVRMFLITQVVRRVQHLSKLPLGHALDKFPTGAKTLADREWILRKMTDSNALEKRRDLERQLQSLQVAYNKFAEIPLAACRS